jgi:hypothetical protein
MAEELGLLVEDSGDELVVIQCALAAELHAAHDGRLAPQVFTCIVQAGTATACHHVAQSTLTLTVKTDDRFAPPSYLQSGTATRRLWPGRGAAFFLLVVLIIFFLLIT